VEEIRKFIGADTLGYVSLNGLLSAVDQPRRLLHRLFHREIPGFRSPTCT
jgi:glutamine phosphoribosylpyrophosphate amidotransferase